MNYEIYALTNRKTKVPYIGLSTADRTHPSDKNPIPVRFDEHMFSLSRGEHYNWILQAAYDASRPTDWHFGVLETLPANTSKHEALQVEKGWIRDLEKTYNIRGTGMPQRAGSRLSYKQRLEIAQRLEDGKTGKALADQYDVSTATISLVRTYHTELNKTVRASLNECIRLLIEEPEICRGRVSIVGTARKHNVKVQSMSHAGVVLGLILCEKRPDRQDLETCKSILLSDPAIYKGRVSVSGTARKHGLSRRAMTRAAFVLGLSRDGK